VSNFSVISWQKKITGTFNEIIAGHQIISLAINDEQFHPPAFL
jgi:hypothetical protein